MKEERATATRECSSKYYYRYCRKENVYFIYDRSSFHCIGLFYNEDDAIKFIKEKEIAS